MAEEKGYAVPGMPDHLFERGEVPMTKQEIRCLTLSRLRLKKGQTVLDVGAGSGGLSVECALLIPEGRVFAVERDPEAVKVIRANLEKFGVQNVTVLGGAASEVLEGTGLPPQFDRVIIGGSGGELQAIIKRSRELLVSSGVIVINCILLETLYESLQRLEEEGFSEISYIQAAISRSRRRGGKTALQPLNPVFVISATRNN